MTGHNKIKNKKNETIKAGCAVLNEKGEILLVSNMEGKIWAFPKGHAENGETLEQTASREVAEETGYKVKILKRLSDLTYNHGQTDELIRVAMFKAILTELGTQTEQNIQAEWFQIEKAKKIIYPNLAFLLDELAL